MKTREDVLMAVNKAEKRYKEAERIQKYLEGQNAPAIRITEIKRIVNFLEYEFNTRLLAFQMTDLAYKNKE